MAQSAPLPKLSKGLRSATAMRFTSILNGSTICRSHRLQLANKIPASAFSGIAFPVCPPLICSHFSSGCLPIDSAACSTGGFVISASTPSFLPASMPPTPISSSCTLSFIGCGNCSRSDFLRDSAVFIARSTTGCSASWKIASTAAKLCASPLFPSTLPGNLPNILAGAMPLSCPMASICLCFLRLPAWLCGIQLGRGSATLPMTSSCY